MTDEGPGVRGVPVGPVTFLLTDIEGSTALWERHHEAMRVALTRHDALVGGAVAGHDGVVVKSRGEGDSLFCVFGQPTDAVRAAYAIQQALHAEPWLTPEPLRVRIAVHTGPAEQRERDYYGPSVNRCARLRAVGHGGQVLLTAAVAAQVREQLPVGVGLRDLGEHRLRDLVQPEHIFELEAPDLPGAFPPLKSLSTHPNNLPLETASFVGRDRERAEVKDLLRQHRLVTLTGTGGVGKSRLALHVAAEQLDRFPHGVFLVELAPLADPALVPQSVATALHVREEPGRALLDTLLQTLKSQQLLLLLDNCEHLIDACAQFTDALVRACPGVHLLATSREALAIAGEATYHVPSLALPDPEQPLTVERLVAYEAVRLFCERAVAVQPRFAVTSRNAPVVAQICHRLDGIPLAIELAAARVRALPVETLAQRLDDRFRLLTGGSRTALPRQQTLRALIDWSYDLLSDDERTLLRRLSVFAGGWSLEAAEQVCAGEPIEEVEVLDRLSRLVEKSLVVLEESDEGEARYRLLETVRQYAWDRLAEDGETTSIRARHCACFLSLAERADRELRGPDQASWQCRLTVEHDNLRVALDWAQSLPWDGVDDPALRLGAALWWFWYLQVYLTEGRRRLAELLDRGGMVGTSGLSRRIVLGAGMLAKRNADFTVAHARLSECIAACEQHEDDATLALALTYRSATFQLQGDPIAARPLAERAAEVARRTGDLWLLGAALVEVGFDRFLCGDSAGARSALEESLAIFRQQGNPWGLGQALIQLGIVELGARHYPEARTHLEACLPLFRTLGDRFMTAQALNSLGDVARCEDDPDRAADLHAESLGLFAEIGHESGVAALEHNLGYVALRAGRADEAAMHLSRSLDLFRRLGDRRGALDCLMGIAGVLVHADRAEAAARLLGAATALHDALGTVWAPSNAPDHERIIVSMRTHLGLDALSALALEGRSLSFDEAADLGQATLAEWAVSRELLGKGA